MNPAVPITHLLYLHGFRSSPLSSKARKLCRAIHALRRNVLWWSPQLPASPAEASQCIAAGTKDWPTESMAVVGSSLGGYYANWLAERKRCRAVLLNPAVQPARSLASSVGQLTRWHAPEQRFDFKAEYLDELRALAVTQPANGGQTLAIIAKGDEVLDWREMAQQHAGAHLHILDGGDHGLTDFDVHLPRILAFLGLGAA